MYDEVSRKCGKCCVFRTVRCRQNTPCHSFGNGGSKTSVFNLLHKLSHADRAIKKAHYKNSLPDRLKVLIKQNFFGGFLHFYFGIDSRQNPICAEWNSEEQVLQWRKAWEDVINLELERKQLNERVDCRSFKERGIDVQPTIHEGVTARIIKKCGGVSERCELNRQIKTDNLLLRKLRELVNSLENTAAKIAEKLENIRNNLIILTYKIKFNKKQIKQFSNITVELEQKIAERKKLQSDKKRMRVQLARAGIPLSPKEYLARSVLMAAAAMILSGLFVSVTMKHMLPVSAILAVIVFFHFHGEVKDKLNDKDKMIEAELPKFIRAIVQGMKTEKDIIKLLETYETIAGKGLKYDIEVLIMDLKSGNFEEGMMDFDKRVGNAYISRLAKALISANRGDNQDSALNYLLSDMGVLAKETMQRELNKRPGRVKALSIPVVIVAVAALFYVIGVNLFNSLGGIM